MMMKVGNLLDVLPCTHHLLLPFRDNKLLKSLLAEDLVSHLVLIRLQPNRV
jgi:hypothetical protein